MKFKYSIVCVAILAATVSSEAVVNIQNVGAGARSQALGNSFVAVADNADAAVSYTHLTLPTIYSV